MLDTDKQFLKISGSLVASVLTIPILWGSFYTVNEYEKSVVTRFGKVIEVSDAGLHFKVPLIDSVSDVSIQTHTATFKKMESYSSDQQAAELRISVTYKVSPSKVRELYSNFRSLENAVERILSPITFQQTKVVFGQFTASRAIQERAKLNYEIKEAIQNSIQSDIFQIESVQVEDITFQAAYLKSIEDRMIAEVEVLKLQQNSEREKVQAQIVATQAKAQAEALLLKSKAEADAIKLKGDAEASAIKARADALKENKNLVGLIQAEKWDGKLPVTMLPNSSVPMINLNVEK